MLLLTVAIKMKFNLCTIAIAFTLKSGVYCNRISDFATHESLEDKPTQAVFGKNKRPGTSIVRKLAKHQEEGKDTSGRLC